MTTITTGAEKYDVLWRLITCMFLVGIFWGALFHAKKTLLRSLGAGYLYTMFSYFTRYVISGHGCGGQIYAFEF